MYAVFLSSDNGPTFCCDCPEDEPGADSGFWADRTCGSFSRSPTVVDI